MKVFPVLLDSRPPYLRRDTTPSSLLLMPLATGTLLSHTVSSLSALQPGRLTVMTAFEPSLAYEVAVRKACPAVEAVVYAAELSAHLASHEPSDWLLMVDPRFFPVEGLAAEGVLSSLASAPRWVRHLLALEPLEAGTRECVEFDAEGRVRRIQRYYDAVTWTFASGVCCSALPASCAMMLDVPFTSLNQLRSALSARGVPSSDVRLRGAAYDLGQEEDFLDLNEQVILGLQAPTNGGGHNGNGLIQAGEGCQVDPTARIFGPVVLQQGAIIEAGATVVGPAVIGAKAHVRREAIVAQCVLGPGADAPERVELRHRLVLGGQTETPRPWGHDEWALLRLKPAMLHEEGAAPRRLYPRIKAVAEAVLSLLTLLVLSPLLLLIAVAIRLDSRGSVFHSDRREGLGGREFGCLKYRTMRLGADALQRELEQRNEVDGPQFKMDDDPRVTRLGRFLRKVSLDELPQLINVVMGQMSLVGPRPSPFRENQMCIPWREARLSVRPGISGLWQVCRHERKSGDFHQWIYYDLLYVQHMSFWVDVKIAVATVITLGGKGHVPLRWIIPASRLGSPFEHR